MGSLGEALAVSDESPMSDVDGLDPAHMIRHMFATDANDRVQRFTRP